MQEHLPESIGFAPIDEKKAEGSDPRQQLEDIDRLHPTLRESFMPLPKPGIDLTANQLNMIFGGDWRALRDITKLIFQPEESKQNKNR